MFWNWVFISTHYILYLTIYNTGRKYRLNKVNSIYKQYKHIGFNCFTKLFERGVEPVCSYGSGIWGYDKFLLGQKIQLRALRYFLGVHKQTPTLAINGDSGWLNMKYKHYPNMLK